MAEKAVTRVSAWVSTHPKTFGLLILLGLHAVFVLGPIVISSLGFFARGDASSAWTWLPEWTGFKHEAVPLLIGVVQLYYVIPAVLLALKLKYPAVAKGILQAAIATFLLNAGGCAIFVWQLTKIDG
ncbi:MAG: hypothetical protein EXR27_08660 [Betaproteobacteria bacterium]|nr:hypothetical protein [Betaproteobacteria bacterium]